MSTEASVRCLGVDGSSSTLVRLGRRLRSDLPALLERLRVDNGTMGIFCAVEVEEEKAVRGRGDEHAGSAGRLRSRLTSNFWDAVELDGEDGASATVNGRRGDEAQLGVDVGADTALKSAHVTLTTILLTHGGYVLLAGARRHFNPNYSVK